MAITCKIDRRQLEAKLRRMVQAGPEARRAGLRILGRDVLTSVVNTSPRDTNRFVNGWAMAGNAAGIGPFQVRPLEKASRHAQIRARLLKQFDKWDRIVRLRYESKGRVQDKWYRQAKRRRDAAFEQLRRFDQGGKTAIAFDLYDWQRRGKRELTTIRHRVYGGTGRIVQTGNRSYLELHNREPHATIVEGRKAPMRKAMLVHRGVGLHKAGRGYIAKVAQASGMASAVKR